MQEKPLSEKIPMQNLKAVRTMVPSYSYGHQSVLSWDACSLWGVLRAPATALLGTQVGREFLLVSCFSFFSSC